MLTEIEWWGGLLFVWGALCYKGTSVSDGSAGWLYKSVRHLTYLLAAAVLALYFYPLQDVSLKYGYVGAVALGVLFTVLFFTLDSGDSGDESEENDDDGNEESEGDEKVALALAYIILGIPLVASLTLGAWKSYLIAGEIGWIG